MVMGEQMDKAKVIIDSIPPGGACIVTLTNEVARWFKRGIRERLGGEMALKCRAVGIHRMSSVCKIVGETRPVIFDHSFTEKASEAVKVSAYRLANGINAMHPPY